MDDGFVAGVVVGALAAFGLACVVWPCEDAQQIAALRAQVLAEVALARDGFQHAVPEVGDA